MKQIMRQHLWIFPMYSFEFTRGTRWAAACPHLSVSMQHVGAGLSKLQSWLECPSLVAVVCAGYGGVTRTYEHTTVHHSHLAAGLHAGDVYLDVASALARVALKQHLRYDEAHGAVSAPLTSLPHLSLASLLPLVARPVSSPRPPSASRSRSSLATSRPSSRLPRPPDSGATPPSSFRSRKLTGDGDLQRPGLLSILCKSSLYLSSYLVTWRGCARAGRDACPGCRG